MTARDAWRLLGIAATDDSRAIRRAYAAQLRALDVDEDRTAFAALRDARDYALAIASQAAALECGDETAPAAPDAAATIDVLLNFSSVPIGAPMISAPTDISATLSTPIASPDPDDIAFQWKSDGWAAGTTGEAIDLALPRQAGSEIGFGATPTQQVSTGRVDHALYAILYADPNEERQETALEPVEITQASALIDRLHDEARHGAIDLFGRVEAWLSDVLAGAWPRSHPLLPHAAALFGWTGREGQIGVPAAIDFINRRMAAERFEGAVRLPGHRLNRAWRQLAVPTRPGQSRALWRDRKKIDELLGVIRRDYPELESRFDWHRVALWDNRGSGSGFPVGRAIWIGILVFQVLVALTRFSTDPPPPVAAADDVVYPQSPSSESGSPAILGRASNIDSEVRDAIAASLGDAVTPTTLRARAPLVYALFESNWHIGLDMGRTRAQYIETMVRVMGNRYALLARQAGGVDLADFQRRRVAEERLLKGSNWKACAAVVREGGLADPGLIPAKTRNDRRKTVAELILANPENPVPNRGGGTFSIPGEIVTRTVDASGLKLDQVTAAFRGKGTDREQCLTHIALLNTVLTADAKTRARLLSVI